MASQGLKPRQLGSRAHTETLTRLLLLSVRGMAVLLYALAWCYGTLPTSHIRIETVIPPASGSLASWGL